MEEATRQRFKWKFYKLAVLLNIIILLIAVGIIALFKAPAGYQLPVAVTLFACAGVTAFYFRRNYRATQAWLDENA
jgi:hypothetical protein